MAVSYEVRAARPGDADALAAVLRPGDAAELDASLGLPPLDALRWCVREDPAACFLSLDGQPAALFGVNPTDVQGVGCAWALTGAVVERFPLAFVRLSRKVVGVYLEDWPVLFNLVDARYTRALRWLASLGFSQQAPVPHGPRRLPFVPCVLRRPPPHV